MENKDIINQIYLLIKNNPSEDYISLLADFCEEEDFDIYDVADIIKQDEQLQCILRINQDQLNKLNKSKFKRNDLKLFL